MLKCNHSLTTHLKQEKHAKGVLKDLSLYQQKVRIKLQNAFRSDNLKLLLK